MYCSKCGAQNKDASSYCAKCGVELRQVKQVSPRYTSPANPASPTSPSTTTSPHSKPQVAYTSTTSPSTPAPKSYTERYDDGPLVIFTCIAGIITSLLAFFTLSGTWVSLKLYSSYSVSYPLRGFSALAKDLSSVMQYFDSSATTGLNIMSLAASISYWILLLGAIVSLAISLIILATPKAQPLVFIPYIIIIAFAVIGLVFTAPMLLMSQYIGVCAIPIVMLVIAGIPAVVLRLLG